MDSFEILQSILGFGLNLIAFFFRIIFAFIAGFIALTKGRNFFFWGMITLFLPWIFFIILFIPRRYPQFHSHIMNKEEFRGKNPVIASIMALSAMVAKSDGSVSKEEIFQIKKFISANFGITFEELSAYGSVFDYGKNHPEEYREFTRVINTFYRRKDYIIAIAYLFVSIAMQDSRISENEDVLIRSILHELGLSSYEYESIKNAFTHRQGYYYNNQNAQEYVGNKDHLIRKYTKVLQVDEGASLTEIKKAYRRLVKEYHPDKMASKGMPEDYREFANNKIKEINEAYDYLSKLKGA